MEQVQVGIESNCDGCTLCTVSKKAHGLRDSSRDLWNKVSQRSRNVYGNCSQRIASAANNFSESHPETITFMRSLGQRIYYVAGVLCTQSLTVYHRAAIGIKNLFDNVISNVRTEDSRQFEMTNTKIYFLYGGSLIISGSVLLITLTTIGNEASNCIWLIMMGACFIWIPIVYWMTESRGVQENDNSRLISDESSQSEISSKPPEYETLLSAVPSPFNPTIPPPAYEDLILISSETQGALPYMSSGAGCIGVPLCSVHQCWARPETLRVDVTPQIARPFRLTARSRSLENLHSYEASHC